jgi:hypothetical protein
MLELTDDRGKAVAGSLRVCFQLERSLDCRQIEHGEAVQAPAAFVEVTAEGDDYGPVKIQRQAIPSVSGGALRLTVGRKALLVIKRAGAAQPVRPGSSGGAGEALSVSLYRPEDMTFREPAFRALLAAGETTVKVPAGDFIAALTGGAQAPDLHRLAVLPAALARLDYKPRPGWSLVVRSRAEGDGKAVRDTEVKIAEIRGYGRPEAPIATAMSGTDGLALFSGLTASLASLAASHAGFLPTGVHDITAGPGTFTFRDVQLAIGGRLIAHVAVHGRALPEASCEVDAVDVASPAAHQASQTVWQGKTDSRGACSSTRLAAGDYKLRIRIQDGLAASRWITVREGQDHDEDVALAASHVAGTVSRGAQPAEGYQVRAMRLPGGEPAGSWAEELGHTVSDETGKYDLTVWSAGSYVLALKSPTGTPIAGHKSVDLADDDSQTVDFALNSSAVTGVVVDPAGQPLPGAWVAIYTSDGTIKATTDQAGAFAVDAQAQGHASVQAGKAGFRGSDRIDVDLSQDGQVPPITLSLKRNETLHGTVLTAAGEPVAGALVTSLSTSSDGVSASWSTTSGADGGFDLAVPPGPPRAFVSGPGCPLSEFDLVAPAEGADDDDDAEDTVDPNQLHCAALPAVLELTFLDTAGKPVPHASVILRIGDLVVPRRILATSLLQLGLPADADGAGRLVLANLEPGTYDLFLSGLSSEGAIAAGVQKGFLTSVTLPPLQTSEVQVTTPPQHP